MLSDGRTIGTLVFIYDYLYEQTKLIDDWPLVFDKDILTWKNCFKFDECFNCNLDLNYFKSP